MLHEGTLCLKPAPRGRETLNSATLRRPTPDEREPEHQGPRTDPLGEHASREHCNGPSKKKDSCAQTSDRDIAIPSNEFRLKFFKKKKIDH